MSFPTFNNNKQVFELDNIKGSKNTEIGIYGKSSELKYIRELPKEKFLWGYSSRSSGYANATPNSSFNPLQQNYKPDGGLSTWGSEQHTYSTLDDDDYRGKYNHFDSYYNVPNGEYVRLDCNEPTQIEKFDIYTTLGIDRTAAPGEVHVYGSYEPIEHYQDVKNPMYSREHSANANFDDNLMLRDDNLFDLTTRKRYNQQYLPKMYKLGCFHTQYNKMPEYANHFEGTAGPEPWWYAGFGYEDNIDQRNLYDNKDLGAYVIPEENRDKYNYYYFVISKLSGGSGTTNPPTNTNTAGGYYLDGNVAINYIHIITNEEEEIAHIGNDCFFKGNVGIGTDKNDIITDSHVPVGLQITHPGGLGLLHQGNGPTSGLGVVGSNNEHVYRQNALFFGQQGKASWAVQSMNETGTSGRYGSYYLTFLNCQINEDGSSYNDGNNLENSNWKRVGNVLTTGTGQAMNNFTGQHRTFIDNIPYKDISNNNIGLIVSANKDDFIKMSNGIVKGKDAITINESLPVVSLSSKVNDKSVFGVISSAEDNNDSSSRTDNYGVFQTVVDKEEGDERVFINSLGEGAIWVIDASGSFESGDYITTSNVGGYGCKQIDDVLHNYTVAKITMNCDFNPALQYKQEIKKKRVYNGKFVEESNNLIESIPRDFEEQTTYVLSSDKTKYLDASGAIVYEISGNLILDNSGVNVRNVTSDNSGNNLYKTETKTVIDKFTFTPADYITDTIIFEVSGNVYKDNLNAIVYEISGNTLVNTSGELVTTKRISYDFSGNILEERDRKLNSGPIANSWKGFEDASNNLKYKMTSSNIVDVISQTNSSTITLVNDLDINGIIQWVDSTEQEHPYEIRYVDATGNILTESDYTTKKTAGEAVFKAAFVGCTYHCG